MTALPHRWRGEEAVTLLLQPHVLPLEHHLRGDGRYEPARLRPDLVADEIAAPRPEEWDVGLLLGKEELLHTAQDLPALVSVELAPLLLEHLEEGGVLPPGEVPRFRAVDGGDVV